MTPPGQALVLVALLGAVAAGTVEPNFEHFIEEVYISYQSGETRPYVQQMRDQLQVDLVIDTLKTRSDRISHWQLDISDSVCNTCDFFVGNIIKEFYSGTPLAEIELQALTICEVFKLYPTEVCRGTIGLAAPSIAEVLADRNTTGADICTFALGPKCGADIWPHWEVKLPPNKPPHVDPVLPEPSEVSTLKFVQLSDPHVDLDYTEDALADCDMPMCCRASQGPGVNHTAGPYGALASCDIPMRTLNATLAWVAEHHSDATAIYMTGDLPAHDVWNQTIDNNLRSIHTTIGILKEYFPDIPVFSSIGNHAPCFINIYPPESTLSPTNNITWLSSTFSQLWPTMFHTPLTGNGTIERGSYYSSRLLPGKLRVVSINSNFCNNLNWWLLVDSVDPSGELQWLVDELYEAEQLGEKVHLLSHIPTGSSDCLPVWSHQYNRIISRFEDTVAAQFFGHTHTDEFQVFYDVEDEQRPVGVSFITPAVTTYSYLNPSYRVYTMDAEDTWMALDYDDYIMNLTLANTAGDTSFTKLYSARADLLEAAPTPHNYHLLVERMRTDRAKFDQYLRYFYHSDVRSAHEGPCDEACRERSICRADSSDSSVQRC